MPMAAASSAAVCTHKAAIVTIMMLVVAVVWWCCSYVAGPGYYGHHLDMGGGESDLLSGGSFKHGVEKCTHPHPLTSSLPTHCTGA